MLDMVDKNLRAIIAYFIIIFVTLRLANYLLARDLDDGKKALGGRGLQVLISIIVCGFKSGVNYPMGCLETNLFSTKKRETEVSLM